MLAQKDRHEAKSRNRNQVPLNVPKSPVQPSQTAQMSQIFWEYVAIGKKLVLGGTTGADLTVQRAQDEQDGVLRLNYENYLDLLESSTDENNVMVVIV